MRLDYLRPLTFCVPLVLAACGDDINEADTRADATAGTADTGTETDNPETGTADQGDGDGDTGDGDGDGEPGDGDGDGDGDPGDGDGDTGDGDGDTGDGDGDGDTGDGDGDTGDGDGDGDGDPEMCGCAPNTDVIYVLSDDGELWSFNPETLQFDLIANALGCPQNQAFSMSVDRNGYAFVMFQNDDIYTVDVNNANMCSDPGYAPGQMGFNKFGMGFVSNSQFDPCDKLYAHSWTGQGGFGEGMNVGRLGRMDAMDLQMEEIGFINYDGGELTGTGDGRLFAFAGNPAKLVEYDKSDASVIMTEQLNMPLTNAFAFAFYGGDFYMFTESNQPQVSKVTHYDYDDTKDLTTVVAQGPIRIVGAGVSTCVPIAM